MLASNLPNNATSSYLISTASHINNHLGLISRHNIFKLIGREDEFDIDACLYSLYTHQFYRPTNRKHSLRHSFTNKAAEVEYLPGPFSLLPIPDEHNLYVASPILDESLGWDVFETIPSAEYLVSSYSWQNLFLIPQVSLKFKSYIENYGLESLHSLLGKNLGITEANEKFELIFFNNFLRKEKYIPLRDVQDNPGKVKHEIVGGDELLRIITDNTILDSLFNDQSFHYLAYKKIGSDSALRRQKNLDSSQLVAQKHKSSEPKTTSKVLHVVFCDSLDINTLINNGLIKKYSNIKKLVEKSINFSRFTSSGAWTYPCLYSMYSGIPPYWSFSLFPARVDPTCRLSKDGEGVFGCEALFFLASVLWCSYKYDHKNDYLSRRLRAHDIGQFALKQSSNHSWLYGLQHSTDFLLKLL